MVMDPQHPTFNERQAAIRKHKKKMADKKAARAAKREWDALTEEDRKLNQTYEDKLAAAYKRYNEGMRKMSVMIGRMGMEISYIVERPSDMTETKVVERIDDVLETNHRVPSIGDLLNDYDLGNAVRMLTGHETGHEAFVCSARNRIFLRGRQVEDAEKMLQRAMDLVDTLFAKSVADDYTHIIGDKIDKLREDIANLRSMDPKLDEETIKNET